MTAGPIEQSGTEPVGSQRDVARGRRFPAPCSGELAERAQTHTANASTARADTHKQCTLSDVSHPLVRLTLTGRLLQLKVSVALKLQGRQLRAMTMMVCTINWDPDVLRQARSVTQARSQVGC